MDARQLLKEKKFWFAFALIAWAAALQGHMMWLRKQESFQQKFGNLEDDNQESGKQQKVGNLEDDNQESFEQKFGNWEDDNDYDNTTSD